MLAVALSPQARALIQADRDAHRPTVADRQRVSAALRARLGPSVLPAETPFRDLLLSVGWRVPSGAAFGLCLMGGMLFLALRPAALQHAALVAPSEPAPVITSPVTEAIAPSAAPLPANAGAAASASAAPGSMAVALTQARTSDPLAQEVALLSRAMTQLRSGNASEALQILEQHQARFPKGALSQERFAMKAQALCKLQRFREGRVELDGLKPGSIAYEHVKPACDAPARTSGR